MKKKWEWLLEGESVKTREGYHFVKITGSSPLFFHFFCMRCISSSPHSVSPSYISVSHISVGIFWKCCDNLKKKVYKPRSSTLIFFAKIAIILSLFVHISHIYFQSWGLLCIKWFFVPEHILFKIHCAVFGGNLQITSWRQNFD